MCLNAFLKCSSSGAGGLVTDQENCRTSGGNIHKYYTQNNDDNNNNNFKFMFIRSVLIIAPLGEIDVKLHILHLRDQAIPQTVLPRLENGEAICIDYTPKLVYWGIVDIRVSSPWNKASFKTGSTP